MKKYKYVLTVMALGAVLAGCGSLGKTALVEHGETASGASETAQEGTTSGEASESDSGVTTEAGTANAGSESAKAKQEATKDQDGWSWNSKTGNGTAGNGSAGTKDGNSKSGSGKAGMENPLYGLGVKYAGEYGEWDDETIKLIDCFLSTYNKKVDKSKIRTVTVADFDNDGNVEAFIFYGEEDDICSTGEYCFVDAKKTQSLGQFDVYASDGYIDCGDKKFAYFDEYYATSAVSHIFELSHGKPVETNISRIGSVYQMDDGTLSITFSNYDAMYDKEMGTMLGHTWLPYYFTYDRQKGKFIENGGLPLPLDQIDSVAGFDLLEQIKSKGYYISDAMIRSNGLLIVNMVSVDENTVYLDNLTYDFRNKVYHNSLLGDSNDFYDAIDAGVYFYSISADSDTDSNINSVNETLKLEVKNASDIIEINGYETLVLGEYRGTRRAVRITSDSVGKITNPGTYEVLVSNGVVERVK